MGKVLKMDRPDGRRVRKFDGAFGPRVVVSPLRAMSIKPALRIYFLCHMTCFLPCKVVAPATKGVHTEMVPEVYDALFFSPYLSFPLEGKSREAGKGVRG